MKMNQFFLSCSAFSPFADGGLIEGQAVQLEDGTTAYIQQVTEKGIHRPLYVNRATFFKRVPESQMLCYIWPAQRFGT